MSERGKRENKIDPEIIPWDLNGEQPGLFCKTNWIINQNFVGKSSGCDGAYTYGDVQWAIWQLVDEFDLVDYLEPVI